MGHHSSFYKNTLWQYGLQIVKYLFPLITLPYLTRVLEPSGYAVYAYVVSFMSFAQVFVDFGFELSGTKQIARAKSVNEENRVIGAITQARLVLCFFTGAIVMVLAYFLPITHGYMLYVLLAYVAACGKSLLPDFVFQGHEDMGPMTMRFLVSKGVSTVLTFVFVHSIVDLLWIPILDILSSVIALIWSFASAKRMFGTTIARVPMSMAFAELKTSGLYCFSNMAATAFSGFTTLLIGVVVTDVALIAYWSLAMTAVGAVQSLYAPIVNSLYPHMVNTGDFVFAKKMAILAIPAVLVGTIAFALLSKVIMLLLGGESYIDGAWVLVWVSPVLVFSFFAMLFGWPVLGAADKIIEVTKTTIISALFCIVSLLVVSIAGFASLQAICIVRNITEMLLCGLRVAYALPVLKSSKPSQSNADTF